MFVHDGLLQPALEPDDYISSAVYEQEHAAVFSRGWHPLATRAQLARDGAFVSTDVAGLPVLLRNEGGSLCAFVNVCAHRHSLLESPGCGVRDVLRCGYHGWEYDVQGNLRKLPDGRSFKGLRAVNVRLRKLRVECLGPIVYVGLDESEPDLITWLGPLADELRPFFERPLRSLFVRSSEYAVNWKVIVENAVESYHVPMVHPQTFRYYRVPALHDHRIEPGFTRYADLEPWSTSYTGRALALYARAILPHSDGKRFRHAHCFPNQLYYFGDLLCDLSVVTPLGPQRSRHTSFLFLPDETRLPRLTAPLHALFGELLARQARRLLAEDRGVWAAVQSGLAHARERGVLSAREERVFAFQRWLADRLGRPREVTRPEPPPATSRTTPR